MLGSQRPFGCFIEITFLSDSSITDLMCAPYLYHDLFVINQDIEYFHTSEAVFCSGYEPASADFRAARDSSQLLCCAEVAAGPLVVRLLEEPLLRILRLLCRAQSVVAVAD